MPLMIEKLRLAIVALAVVLLLGIVGSFFYGRWRMRHLLQDIPGRLGVQIQQSTKGFVLSQSNSEGRTLFTLRAARAVEFKFGGRVSLHDVKIELYNEQNGEPDTIAGEDFAYDPHSQIVQSQGESHIVLHTPGESAGARANAKGVNQRIAITTHGLVFNRKTGVATCSGEVDFQTLDSSGQAMGAEFDSKQGHLLLESQVVLTTTMQNEPATLHATRAMYDRDEGQIHLWQPRYTSQTPKGTRSGMAGRATIFLRADNSAERLDAAGGVRLASVDGMGIRAQSMQVLLSKKNEPRQANFSGGVEFAGNQQGVKTLGDSRSAKIDFDSHARARRVILNGTVQFRQQADTGKNPLQRTLAANHLVLNLVPEKIGQEQLQSADATGDAVFTSASAVPGQAAQKTILAAQVLNTAFNARNQPATVDGTGQTRLQMIAANGDLDTSTGDTLHIEFAPSAPRKSDRQTGPSVSAAADQLGVLNAQSIRTAVQTGHVVLQQSTKGNNGAPGARISTATAARASYAAANDTLILTGNPVFRDAQLELTARRIEVERGTGKVVSTGVVQATMQSGNAGNRYSNAGSGLLGGTQPVHIIADQAVMLHEAQKAVFSGRARLWQGGNTIEAPVIELSQKRQTLTAYSDRPCTQCVVGNFLGGPGGTAHSKQIPLKGTAPPIFRVLSERLVYSGAERKASFLHHVQVFSSSGDLTADQAEIFLAPSGHRAPAGSSGKPEKGRGSTEQSSVGKMIASGDVRLAQPGRSATGTKLIYTAVDGHFVLTGDDKNPPEVADRDHGTVTGQVLTFASREQAIMVSSTSGHTTTTKTRVQQR